MYWAPRVPPCAVRDALLFSSAGVHECMHVCMNVCMRTCSRLLLVVRVECAARVLVSVQREWRGRDDTRDGSAMEPESESVCGGVWS